MTTKDTLENLGLSQRQAKIYLAALKLGKSLPKHLAEQAGVKRPTLYKELPELLEKGLLSETTEGKRRVLVAEDPEVLLDLKRTQLNQFEQTLPQLRALLNTASAKPVINFYEGIEGMKRVYFDNLREKKPILEFIGLAKINPEIENYIMDYYVWERVKRKISIKILVSGQPKYGRINLTTDPAFLRKVQTVSEQDFPFPLDCYIYGDNVSFLIYRVDSEPAGMIIRSKEISTTMKSIFNLIWQNK